ncbi:MAG: GNAT family N-acetyltransferase [Solirubrobacterales bacterium]
MNAPAVEIRTASETDVDRVLELWAAARSAYATTTDTPESIAVLRTRDQGALLVAERDGRVVGTLIAAFDGWRGGMYRLAVDPGHRREGIGAALIRAGESRLRQAGARRISVLVGFGDEVAIAAWEAAGYRRDTNIGRLVKNV